MGAYAEHESLQLLQERLEQVKDEIVVSMANDPAPNFPEYTKRLGIVHGLGRAIMELKELDEDLLHSD